VRVAVIRRGRDRSLGYNSLLSRPQETAAVMTAETSDFQARKKAIREQAHANRNAQPDKEQLSALICSRLIELPAYRDANTVMWYVDVRSEVRTRYVLPETLTQGKTIVVPYCVAGELELFRLDSMDELATGAYRILEPKAELRGLTEKKVAVAELDLVVVPGVAFDRRGARMGHGFGYYDRLLKNARPDAPLVALAFECQLFDEIPTESHDVFMDLVITQKAVYQGRGRKEAG
jgi:5-formyltetrahydrofolate cyclo-ligase